jgi:hypothetical protein
MATPKKKVAQKRTAARKAPVKKTTKQKSAPRYQSFRLSKDAPPLMTFKITRQTVYWIVIMSFIIFFQLTIIKLQLQVAQVINQQQEQLQQDQ